MTVAIAQKAMRRGSKLSETGADPVSGPRSSARRRRIPAAHSPKFQAVTVPTTAANWWLFRVAWRLR